MTDASALPLKEMKQDRIALDRATQRRIDADGHLHVESSNISKANICPYWGGEIPDNEALGLDPKKTYRLLRDPAELDKAAPTFNGKPLLILHKVQTADGHDHDLTVGSVSNVYFEAPYLKAELSVWDAAAIAGIDSGEQKELSSAYRYVADMTPGTYEGEAYDGRMVSIIGNHVALVTVGRAGSDVVVGDSALSRKPTEISPMAKNASVLSRQALLASGALHAYLLPKIAADAKIDLNPVLKGVTAANWKASKPKIKTALDAATKDKLAKDADLGDVIELLDQLDDAVDDVAEVTDTSDTPSDDPVEDDADGLTAEEEEEYQRLLKKRKAPAMDADKPDDKKDDKPAAGPSKAAMDAAIRIATDRAVKDAVAATTKRLGEIRDAELDVRPYIGDLAIAQDSALGVYRLALDSLGIDTKDITDTKALSLVLNAQPKPGATPTVAKTRVAMDSSLEAEIAKRFPGATAPKRR